MPQREREREREKEGKRGEEARPYAQLADAIHEEK